MSLGGGFSKCRLAVSYFLSKRASLRTWCLFRPTLLLLLSSRNHTNYSDCVKTIISWDVNFPKLDWRTIHASELVRFIKYECRQTRGCVRYINAIAWMDLIDFDMGLQMRYSRNSCVCILPMIYISFRIRVVIGFSLIFGSIVCDCDCNWIWG